jgi:hypothetical protein
VRTVVSGDVDAVTAVELQHAAIEVLRRQRPACIDAAGVGPGRALPVMPDVGTNRKDLLDDPLYLGNRHARVDQDTYDAFIQAYVTAATKLFPGALLHWEDVGAAASSWAWLISSVARRRLRMRSARSVTASAADGIDSTREAWLFTRKISNHPSTSKAAPMKQGLRLAFGHDLALRSKANRWALRRRAPSPQVCGHRPVAVRAAGPHTTPSPLRDCAPGPQGDHQNRGYLAAAWRAALLPAQPQADAVTEL